MKPKKIIKMLKSGNKEKAQGGLKHLISLLSSDPKGFAEVIPDLAEGMKDGKRDIRLRFIVTTGIIGKDNPEAVQGLIVPLAHNLQDRDEEIKYKTAYSLYIIAHKYHKAVKDAIPIMYKAIQFVVAQGAYPSFRTYKPYTLVLRTMKLVGMNAPGYVKKSLPLLQKCLQYPLYHPENPHMGLNDFYSEAILNMGYIGRRFPAAVRPSIPTLMKCYIDTFKYGGGMKKTSLDTQRSATIEAFDQLSRPLCKDIVNQVLEYSSNPNNYGRKSMETLFDIVGKQEKRFVNALISNFESEKKEVREKAASVLERYARRRGETVLKAMGPHINKGKTHTRIYSLITLGMIARHLKMVPEHIIKDVEVCSKSKSSEVRWTAVSTLGTLAEIQKDIVPEVLPHFSRALDDEFHQVRWTTIYALFRIGEKHGKKAIAPVVPGLINKLEDPYDQVRWKAIDTLKKLNIDRYQYPHILNELKGSERLIADLLNQGAGEGEIKHWRDEIKRVYTLLYDAKYQKALDLNASIKNELITRKTGDLDEDRIKAGKMLKDARSAIESARKKGFDTSKADELLMDARSAMKAKDYKELKKIYENINTTLSQSISEQAKAAGPETKLVEKKLKDKLEGKEVDFTEIINWLEEQILSAKKKGIDVSNAKKILSQAKSAIDMDSNSAIIMSYITDTKIALKDAKTAEESERELSGVANDALASAMALVTSAKAQDVDVSVAEKLVKEAEQGLTQKDYAKVIKFASKAEENAKKYLKIAMLSKASEELVEIGEWVEDAKDFGLDTTEAGKLLEMARKAFKEEDFEGVERYIRMIKEALDVQKKGYIKRQAEELYHSVLSEIKTANTEGIDLSGVEELLEEAEKALEGGDYEALYEKTLKIEEMMSNKKTEYVRSEAEKALKLLEEGVWHLDKLGLLNEDLETKMKKAKELYDKESYTQAKSFAKDLASEVEAIMEVGYKSALRRKILGTKVKAEQLEKEGYDILEIMDDIQETMELFDGKSYIQCENAVVDLESKLDEIKHQREISEATDAYLRQKAEKVIEDANTNEIEDETFRMYLEKAQEYMDEKSYDDAILLARKAIKISKEKKEK